MKIRIKSVSQYVNETCEVDIGDVFEVISTKPALEKTGEHSHLIQGKNGKHIVMYSSEVQIIEK